MTPCPTSGCPLPEGHSGRCVASLRLADLPGPTCRGPACEREAVHAGLCATHYAQRQRVGALTPIRPYGAPDMVTIKVALPRPTIAALDAKGPTRAAAMREILDAWAAAQR